MKRLIASLMVAVFVVGMLVLPAIHRLHCDCHEHHAADCPICQLAHAPLDSASTSVTALPAPPAFSEPGAPVLAAVASGVAHDPTQARAPPPAAMA